MEDFMALTDETKKEDDIIDLNIDVIKKQRFRINGDPNSVIELNLSDLRIYERLEKGLAKLQEEMHKIAELSNDDENLSNLLNEADAKMCEWMDYIFDSPISAVFSKSGSMYDPFNGVFRYEHIIDTLTKLYTNNINDEYKKMRARIQKNVSKYTANKTTKGKKK